MNIIYLSPPFSLIRLCLFFSLLCLSVFFCLCCLFFSEVSTLKLLSSVMLHVMVKINYSAALVLKLITTLSPSCTVQKQKKPDETCLIVIAAKAKTGTVRLAFSRGQRLRILTDSENTVMINNVCQEDICNEWERKTDGFLTDRLVHRILTIVLCRIDEDYLLQND